MAVYYVWSGATGSGNGSSWANAFTTLTTAFVTEIAGDTLYVAHDHAESSASGITLTSSGSIGNVTKIVCVNRAGSVPPVSADRRATATVTTTGFSNISFNGVAHYDGIIFNCGVGSSAVGIVVCVGQGAVIRFDNCSLRIATTNASGTINIGSTNVGGIYSEWNNTTVSFGNTAHTIGCFGRLKWRNTASALLGTIPGALFTVAASRGGGWVECVGVDFSAAGSGKTLVYTSVQSQAGSYQFIDCKINAAVTPSSVPSTLGSADSNFVRSSATGNYAVRCYRLNGSLTEETTIVRSGGASDGTTTISWKVVTLPEATYSVPFECPPIAIWNDTTGSAKTATVECIASAIMTDQEIWLDLEYLGDASSPQGSFVNDGKADLLASAANQTSSSASWGGSTTPFKLEATFTAQQKGWIYARVKVGKASSTVYIDPLVTLT